uniref:Uncharacterized protein n=1 Tax=Brassica oleracea TaxID=3712 RepID=A0A3P6EGM0_BRAOL|nr:unnamed protein product [Brassica oleracea]
MVVYKEAPSPWIMHRCKENAAVAVPKKSGRPKRKSQGGCRLTRRGRSVKQSLRLMYLLESMFKTW